MIENFRTTLKANNHLGVLFHFSKPFLPLVFDHEQKFPVRKGYSDSLEGVIEIKNFINHELAEKCRKFVSNIPFNPDIPHLNDKL